MVRPIPSFAALGFAGILCALQIYSQTPSAPAPPAAPVAPAPLPNGPAPQTGVSSDQGTASVATIRTFSNLVIIDVVVSDSKGNPVHGLKESDFTLTESNKPQNVRSFEEHSALPASETQKIAPAEPPHPGVFTNKAVAPANGPVNVLLLDYLNTPLTAQPYARKQLMDFLDKAPPGTRIAIFGLNTGLSMLQGFTSNPATLKAALSAKKGSAQVSDILNDAFNGGGQTNTSLSENFTSDALDADQQLANVLRFEATAASFQQDLRTKITLGAFDQLASYLVGISGRKNLIWFSGSFPLSIEPQTNLQDPFDSVVRNDDQVRKTDNLLTRAQIAVYPVDCRGVFNDPSASAANDFPNSAPTISAGTVIPGDPSSQTAGSQFDFLQQTAQEHETMMAMAEDTGGKAFINTNDLTQAVLQAVSNGSNYYTLTYSPNNRIWDGRFRPIKVKVEQPGVKLSYRNGYYGDDPNDRNKVIAGSAAAAATSSSPTTMITAMMHGGPDQTEIPFKVRVRPYSTPPVEKPVAQNMTNPDPKVNITGPFKEYGVDFVPDPHAFSCPASEDGKLHCGVEVATYVYNPVGTLLITTSAKVHTALTPAEYAEMLHTGMAFHEAISVPVKGRYYLRTAIHDLKSDRVGATEISVAAVANLPPIDVLPTPAAAAAPAGSSIDLQSLMPGLNGPASSSFESSPGGQTSPASTPATAPSVPSAPASAPPAPATSPSPR